MAYSVLKNEDIQASPGGCDSYDKEADDEDSLTDVLSPSEDANSPAFEKETNDEGLLGYGKDSLASVLPQQGGEWFSACHVCTGTICVGHACLGHLI